ncbi:MAG: DUF1343 domain-containing protein [Chitinophagaceae bacterium]|nr:DUF1343 domain-containing protein [Oligoflexus sp.]
MKLGIERLVENTQLAKNWGRCAFLGNQASLTPDFKPAWTLLHEILEERLVAFFGPQHGFHATVQDNMIETGHNAGPYGLPVYSLYSETREPKDDMLENVDTIVVDLQITGCRVYTFKYTIAACLRAAKRLGKTVVILDRPNPLGGTHIEGRCLDLKAKSFVGEFEIPMRHGMTTAEATQYFNRSINAKVEIVKLEGWTGKEYWSDLYKHWVLTSPNLPSIDSVYVYPATVMLEGTNISEGRGTGLPFQFVGAPYIKDAEAYAKRIQHYIKSDAVFLRPAEFQPTSQKWAGEVCRGVHIHVIDAKRIETFPLGLAVMRAAMDLGGDAFQWQQPGYEYNYSDLPIDLILGELGAHKKLEAGLDIRDPFWSTGLTDYAQRLSEVMIYPRKVLNGPW